MHDHHSATAGRVTWRTAASATLHCLTGCAIGEVLGMIIGTAFGLPAAATVVLSVILAFAFGYALTVRGVLAAGVGFAEALKLALAADTLSIAVMEIVDNAVVVVVPGAMTAGLASVLFWTSLAVALGVAFLIAWPVNRALIARGRGHAVVAAHHAGHGTHTDPHAHPDHAVHEVNHAAHEHHA